MAHQTLPYRICQKLLHYVQIHSFYRKYIENFIFTFQILIKILFLKSNLKMDLKILSNNPEYPNMP